jgi:hypothetical protein
MASKKSKATSRGKSKKLAKGKNLKAVKPLINLNPQPLPPMKAF